MDTRDDESWIRRHNISHLDAPFFHKEVTLRVVVGVTCIFAILGALIIILSYCLNRDIRTKSRQILVHLSIADMGVALANLVGVIVYFDQYIRECTDTPKVPLVRHSSVHVNVSCKALHGLCKTQAFVAGYSTLASVLWTQILAVYIYCLVILPNSKIYTKVVYFAYGFGWGMPLLILLWLIFTGRLGYSPYGGEGWCSLRVYDDNGELNSFVIFFANDFWIYLTFITVTVLYLSVHCYLKCLFHPSTNSINVVNNADIKFLLIPCCFLLLRVWTQIMVILFVYAKQQLPTGVTRFLIYAAGIGDSGQGIVNAFLFCLLTPRVRQKLLTCFVHVLCCAWFCHAYCREKSRRRSCCCSLWCCCRSKDGDRYSMVHSIASVDLHHSNSVSYPFLHAKVKRYSACTISTTSGSSVTDYDQELSPDMH